MAKATNTPPNTLDSTNPNHLIYRNAMVEITILGGIRLEGLDRLRVTAKIQIEHLAIRHNLDLYNDTQVEKLIRKTSEKLEIGTSVVAGALIDLTEQLEQYRLEAIAKSENTSEAKKSLTEAELTEAKFFLQSKDLLLNTNDLIGKSGVTGEEQNRLLMYIIFTSRKLTHPLHVVSLGSSGTGKTHLQEKVGELIPEEDKLEITTLSENAFYYFGQRQLQNKLILIEDLDGAENVLYPLRELQSKKKISKTVVHKNTKGETRTIHLQVEGPVSVAGCTTKESIYEDNANRSFLIYLDESKEQDEKIMQYQRLQSAGKIDTAVQYAMRELSKNVQRILQPIKIINPYAEQLKLPLAVLKPRRTNSHYLQFIEAVTFYHQYQRKQQADESTGEIYIETTIEDIEQANTLIKETLLRKSDELTGACRNYFEQLKTWLQTENKPDFTNREIRQAFRIAGTTLRRYHNELLNTVQINIIKGKENTGYTYQIADAESYNKLRTGIDSILQNIIQNLQQATTPVVSQKQSGSPKTQKINKKATVSR